MDCQPEEGRTDVLYTASLQERYMAELQGVSKEVVGQLCREQKKTKFDFGEPMQDLTKRVESFWSEHVLPLYSAASEGELIGASHANKDDEEAATNGDGPDENVFLCSHGGTLLALTRSLLNTFHFKLPPDIQIGRASPNTGVTILNTKTMIMERYADVSHLVELGAEEAKREATMEVVDV